MKYLIIIYIIFKYLLIKIKDFYPYILPSSLCPTEKIHLVLLPPVKGIVWEIYECVSEVFSHLGIMSGMIFRLHCRQGSRVPQGACKGVAGRSSIPYKDPDTLWSNTFVHFFGEFWPHQTLKIIPNILPSCDKTSEMHSYISQTIPLI